MSKCIICDNELHGYWTDLHGEISCNTCGTPYQIWFYNDDNERVDKEPLCNVKDEYIPYLQRYWEEVGQNMGLGTYILRYPRPDDRRDFMDWLDDNFV